MCARINQSNLPRLSRFLMHLNLVFSKIKCNVRRMKVIRKILLLDTLVPAANNKIIDAVNRMHLHDMPEDWRAAYFHHRFRPRARLLA